MVGVFLVVVAEDIADRPQQRMIASEMILHRSFYF